MVSGSCSYFIDNKTYQVLAGDIVLIPEGIIHRTDYDGREHTRMLIEIPSAYIPESVREKLDSLPRIYRNPTVSAELYDMLKKLEKEYKSPDDFSEDMIKSMVQMLFFFLIRNKSALTGESHNKMIEDVVGYIQENYASEVRLSQLARDHFVSQEHLSRSFKKSTGFGFNEYLTLVRLKQAEKLLKNQGRMSISEIAYSCGFNDSNYFSDKFKRTYGISPLKFSKQFSEKQT